MATTPIVFSSYILANILSGKTVVASLQGHNPRLDIEIAQELFQTLWTLSPVTMFGD
jgi:hypothetical protein